MVSDPSPTCQPSALDAELMRAAMAIGRSDRVARIVYVCDLPLPAPLVDEEIRRKLVHVVSSAALRDGLDRRREASVLVPGYEMGRQDKFKLALIGATARGYVRQGDDVLGLVGDNPAAFPDTLFAIALEQSAVQATMFGEIGAGRVAPSVFDAIVTLAVELGAEGWEGHALGTTFVVGDVEAVMSGSRQLTINPFRGYADTERNLSNPLVRQSLRNFATLDGAFVVREDGVVEAAGRYLEVVPREEVQIPYGLGARHMAAALVTAATEAIAIVVSQNSGKVRVFRRGEIVLELTPGQRRL